jgi:hypothetical protein
MFVRKLRRSARIDTLCAIIGLGALAVASLPAQPARGEDAAQIVAIVNGDVISRGDVDNRRRLFALSTGLPSSQDVLDRLTPQIRQQLIDERLRLQEVERRRIVVADKDIAKAIGDVEARNGMPPCATASPPTMSSSARSSIRCGCRSAGRACCGKCSARRGR